MVPRKGGMYRVVESMVEFAKEVGVKFKSDCQVDKILIQNKRLLAL